MLVIVSPNTLYSSWVPWEVGYGYDKTDLAVLTLKGIKDENLPDYLQTTFIIRGTKSLNAYVSQIAGKPQYVMESKELIKAHTTVHQLDSYLDWNL